MTDTKQPEALRLADALESRTTSWPEKVGAAVALRRLHAENALLRQQRDAAQEVAAMNAKSGASWAARVQELESQLESIGAGGVEPLRSRCLHQIAEPAVSSQQDNSRDDASYASLSLAEMVLSDCGHSSNYTPLLERVAGRIDRHVERLLTAQQADRAMRANAAPAAVTSPLTKLQRKAIAVCFASAKVSVSEVQRKLSISYADAQTLCQSIVDLGLTDELELAPSLKRGAPASQAAPEEQNESAYQRGYMDGMAKGRRDVEAAPQQEAQHLAQALTDRENQPNQYGVEFGMSGTHMHFKIGNQLFKLAYEPDEQEEFDFMKRMLVNAFSIFTHDVKTTPQQEGKSNG